MSDWRIDLGDCRELMREMLEASVDAIVTDPPYELGFMGKRWDSSGVTYDVSLWKLALAVLKPGGHLVAFGGTRTYHRLACAIEDAGFEIRDTLAWMYGQGFPKSLDVSKAIDKAEGHERGDVRDTRNGPNTNPLTKGDKYGGGYVQAERPDAGPFTEAARQWQGWGTALKPAFEPIILARKPLAGTVAANVLAHGTGALNVDGCRIPAGGGSPAAARRESARKSGNAPMQSRVLGVEKAADADAIGKLGRRGSADVYMAERESEALGRWPANVLLDEAAAALLDEQSGERISGAREAGEFQPQGFYANAIGPRPAGMERAMPSLQATSGGASRFFYTSKASSAERSAGLAERSTHPTVKPLDLMQWLCRLVTPPGGLILDPFAGSGSTVIAALREGFRCVGFEREADYVAVARRRVEEDAPLFQRVAT